MDPKSTQTVETSHQFERANQKSRVRWEDQWTAPKEIRVEDVEGSKPGWSWRLSCALRRQLQRCLSAPHRSHDDVVRFSLPSTVRISTSLLSFNPSSCLAPEGEKIQFLKQVPNQAPSSHLGSGSEGSAKKQSHFSECQIDGCFWKPLYCFGRSLCVIIAEAGASFRAVETL